jgi:hypothetical protein
LVHGEDARRLDATVLAQAQRAAAQAELEGAPPPTDLSDAEVYAMIDSLGDVGAALTDAQPESLSRLYQELGLELRYEPHDRAVGLLRRWRARSGRLGRCVVALVECQHRGPASRGSASLRM